MRLSISPLLPVVLLAIAAFSPQPPDRTAAGAAPYAFCSFEDPEGAPYYAVELISTKRIPGSRMAEGVARVSYQATPFGVSLAPDGSYALDLAISVDRLAPAREGAYVAWITRPDLSEIVRLGPLDERHTLRGSTTWNKYLVVISLEPDAFTETGRWTGPIVLRGMSRSGKMHTMAGHGPFQSEPCAVFGYR